MSNRISKGLIDRNSLFLILIFIVIFPIQVCALSADEEMNIRIYDDVSPSVVNITTTTVSYDFFFNPIPESGTGSGSIIDKKGHILTNYHVVENASKLEVTLFDGSKWEAKLVGADPSNDLAVIRIKAPAERLKPIPFGDSSNLKVGQKAIAIGNPFGLERTLTVGIISSIGRTLRAVNGRLMRGILQTDAAVNPGNSGGPLLDSSGRMIGINTAIFSPVGANIGIGFAIPVNTAKKVVPQLIEKGKVSRPWLGITAQDINAEIANLLKLPSAGILVAKVEKDSPADKAGIRGGKNAVMIGNLKIIIGGDLIIAIDGKPIKNMDQVVEEIEQKDIGQTIELTVLRDKKQRIVRVTLAEMPY